MSTTPPGPRAAAAEFEATADYPPASPASPLDTWVKPSRGKHSSGSGSNAEDPLRAYREEVRSLRESVAMLTNHRDQLQAELNARASKLQVVEQLQQTKDSQHAHQERELEACKEEIAALRENLAAVTTSRDRLQHDLSLLSGKLGSFDQTPGEVDLKLVQLERQLGERDQRIAELTEQMSARSQQHFLDTAERDDLKARLERARADLAAIAQKRGQGDGERERAHRERALARHQQDLTDLQRQVARHREALQRTEAQRQVFECMLREGEQALDERDERLRALQMEAESQRVDHGMALERANKQLAQALSRGGSGDRHFGKPFPGTDERAPEPAMPAMVPFGPDPESRQRISALESQLAEGAQALSRLQLELQEAQESKRALRDALARADRHASDGPSSLMTERAAPVVRESDVTTLVPTPRSGQRLLVRTEGDAGIVQVLTRRTTIGRTPDNDMSVESESVSRHHAVVLMTDGTTAVEDLNSTNGVFVNGVRVQRQTLREGDLLTIGKVSFRFVFKPDAEQA